MSTPPPPGQGPPPNSNHGEPSQGDHPPRYQGQPPDHIPPGYQPPGPPPPGYPQPGYPPPGFQQPAGYPPPGYGQYGYPPPQGYPGGYQPYPWAGGYPTPDDDPLVPKDLGGWFGRIGGVIRRSWRRLVVLQAIGAVIEAALGVARNLTAPAIAGLGFGAGRGAGLSPATVAAESGLYLRISLIGAVVAIVIVAFLFAAGVFVIVREAAGHPTSVADALRLGAPRALLLIGWGVLAWIITTIGLLLILLPGIYLGLVFGASLLGVVVIERGHIGRCFALFHRAFGAALGRTALAAVIGAVYVVIVFIIASLISGGAGSVATPIVQAVLLIPLGMAAMAFYVVNYAGLRFYEDGSTSTVSLAAEMSR